MQKASSIQDTRSARSGSIDTRSARSDNIDTRSARSDNTDTRRLRDLSGVGKSIERNLLDLGVSSVAELDRRDGDELYHALCDKTGTRQDPCVLDTFRCAVAQARDADLPVEQRNWWWWSQQRKAAS